MRQWEKQPDESAEQFRAFLCYLDKRSVEAAYREYIKRKKPTKAVPKKSSASMGFKTWAKAFKWADRASAYDAYLQDQQAKAHIKAVSQFFEERKQLYREMSQKAHDLVAKKMADADAVKLSESIQAVEYYDKEYLSLLERDNLVKLRETLQQ